MCSFQNGWLDIRLDNRNWNCCCLFVIETDVELQLSVDRMPKWSRVTRWCTHYSRVPWWLESRGTVRLFPTDKIHYRQHGSNMGPSQESTTSAFSNPTGPTVDTFVFGTEVSPLNKRRIANIVGYFCKVIVLGRMTTLQNQASTTRIFGDSKDRPILIAKGVTIGNQHIVSIDVVCGQSTCLITSLSLQQFCHPCFDQH